MKVRDLVKILSGVNQDLIVYMSKDPEGNSYSPLWQWSDEYYLDTYDNEVCYSEDQKDDPEYCDPIEENQLFKALILWPEG